MLVMGCHGVGQRHKFLGCREDLKNVRQANWQIVRLKERPTPAVACLFE